MSIPRICRRQRTRLVMATAIAAIALASGMALGHGMIPEDTPVDRLVTNLAQYIKEHPDDADGYYRLGRIHMLALETQMEFVPAWPHEQPAEGRFAKQFAPKKTAHNPSTPEQLRTHLSAAIINLVKAMELKPKEPMYHLTLACALEAGKSLLDDVPEWPLCPVPNALTRTEQPDREEIRVEREQFEQAAKDPAAVDKIIARMGETRRNGKARDLIVSIAYENREKPEFKDAAQKIRHADWEKLIEDQFFEAMSLALPKDRKETEKPLWGGLESLVSYEAGQDFIRVLKARGVTEEKDDRLKVAKTEIKRFDNLPWPHARTPIVLDLTASGLAQLESRKSAPFDLDGSGLPQRWSWLTPDAGILVWDPAHEGHITSGRQLFGSVSWWIFFDNGYQALDALDDNRDGELSGKELDGISIWFDRNGNGISDPGEVIPIYQLGIAALSTHATGTENGCPANLRGVRMADGRDLPSYDWIATRAKSPDRSGFASIVALCACVPALAARRRRGCRCQ